MRYNGFLTADVNGGAAPGFSTGQAQAAVAQIAAETLPKGFDFEWTDLTYQEILAGNSALWVFPIAILLVFLVLAALVRVAGAAAVDHHDRADGVAGRHDRCLDLAAATTTSSRRSV